MSAPVPPRDDRWKGAMALSVVGCAVTLLAALLPAEGLTLGDTVLRISYPEGWRAWLHPDPPQVVIPRWKPEDVSDLLAQYDSDWTAATAMEPGADSLEGPASASAPDSAAVVDSSATSALDSALALPTADTAVATLAPALPIEQPRRAPVPVPEVGALPPALRLSIPESAQWAFGRLFAQLEQQGEVHVLHYGDSQIEGDRISGIMRHSWQKRWGGSGPGLQAPVPLVQSFALRQSHTGPWKRHTRYGRRDTTDADERYGLMACYAELADTTSVACLTVAPEPRNHRQFGQWHGVRVWHDSVATDCAVLVNGVAVDTLWAGTSPSALDLTGGWNGPSPSLSPDATPPLSLATEVCFQGGVPRIFAVEPKGQGVQWHGVPMRGSSGTLFRKLDRPHFTGQLQALGPELVILQYGGNVVPHCKDVAQAERFGGWFGSQIRLFQRVLPDAAILVIGPSDMSEKSGLRWTSFPQLAAVRDVLKRTALENGAGYWDLLEVMGGLGSMPAWVDSEPPLAGPDHVHFTPLGAKRVGTLLDRSFLGCYSEWKQDWAQPAPSTMPKRATSPVIPSALSAPVLETDGLR